MERDFAAISGCPTSAASTLLKAYDSRETVEQLSGNLPHWRQEGVTYFVTFRAVDSLPQEKLAQWLSERAVWLRNNPEPHSDAECREYNGRFPIRLQTWLDEGDGECVLRESRLRLIVEDAVRHFDRERYFLGEFVVMPNHVHAIVTPSGKHALSAIVGSWKGFTARKINSELKQSGPFWQKESFDHIVRSVASLHKFEEYIRDNPGKK
jgi:REP element-mobilizing transposase RayT